MTWKPSDYSFLPSAKRWPPEPAATRWCKKPSWLARFMLWLLAPVLVLHEARCSAWLESREHALEGQAFRMRQSQAPDAERAAPDARDA